MARRARTYSEKLKDPRWQKVRLQVMERDHWTCVNCSSEEKMLSVHHGYYERGLEPWEYPLSTLWTVCEDCHVFLEKERAALYRMLAEIGPSGVDIYDRPPPRNGTHPLDYLASVFARAVRRRREMEWLDSLGKEEFRRVGELPSDEYENLLDAWIAERSEAAA